MMTEIKSNQIQNKARRDKKMPDRMFGWSVGGFLISALMVGGVGYWTMTTKIDGAVIAPGLVALESNRKTVQHLEGGIVKEILVREGETVKAGQSLIRLDTTQDRSELDILEDQLANQVIRHARLRAELTGTSNIALPGLVKSRSHEPKIAGIIADNTQFFVSRRDSRQANATLLASRASRFKAQIDGLVKQNGSLKEELALNEEELDTLNGLYKRKLVAITRVLEVRRRVSRLKSQISGNEAEAESLKSQVTEVTSQLAQAKAAFREEVAQELVAAQSEIHALEERKIAVDDRLGRREIVSPQSGRVLNLGFHSTGGVVAPGQRVMDIIPVEDEPVFLARVPVTDVERVFKGQEATLRLIGFNANSTPELFGTVQSVSADTLIQPETNIPYFSAKIHLSSVELAKLKRIDLVPGMPLEILISTGERLVASYLSRPIADSFARTFRDE